MAFVLFTICRYSSGQDLQNLRFDLLDERQGLSSHLISDIALDSTGFLWVGTRSGLNRYDGHSFKIFRHEEGNPNSLLHDDGQEVWVQKDGKIWITYKNGGLSRFKPDCQCFEHFPDTKFQFSETHNNFSVLNSDEAGNLWLSGEGLGLLKYNPVNKSIQQYELTELANLSAKYNTVVYIHPAAPDLWYLASNNGLYSFNPTSGAISWLSVNNHLAGGTGNTNYNKIIPEGNSGLWLGSWEGGLDYYDLNKKTFKHFQMEDRRFGFYNLIFDIERKSPEELWIASGDRGFGVFNTITESFEFVKALKSTRDANIMFLQKMLVLKNGVIFLVDEAGLLKYNPHSQLFHFNDLKVAESQHGELFHIRHIMENKEKGKTYFATDLADGLNIYDHQTQKLKALPVDVNLKIDPKVRLRSMFVEKPNRIWVLTRDFIYLFNPETQTLVKKLNAQKLPGSKEEPQLLRFIYNADKRVLVLYEDGRLCEFNATVPSIGQIMRIKNTHDSREITTVQRALFDHAGRLWVSGNNNLAVQEKAGWSFVEEKWLPNNFRDNEIRGLSSDNSGNLWIAVSKTGIFQLRYSGRDQLLTKLWTEKEGLPDKRIFYSDVDNHGNVWVSTAAGVGFLKSGEQRFRFYGLSSGMNHFFQGLRFFNSDEGDFYILTPGKYCKVDNSKLEYSRTKPLAFIDKIKVYNKYINAGFSSENGISLKPGEDFFSIEFGSLDLTDQTDHRFAYKLEGWDKSWVDCGNRRFASYTNLNAGEYTFWVKVVNADGIWSEPVKLKIHLRTFFYKQTWFSMVLILFFAGIIYALYLGRIRRIEKEEKIKTEFHRQLTESRMESLRSQMNPHFIFNSLNSINRYIISNDPKTSSLYLTRFAKLMRLVLDHSRHKTISLSSELEALKLYLELEAFRFEKKFSYSITVDNSIDAENIEVPPLIIQPFVENAIWHGLLHKSEPGELAVHINRIENDLQIAITDNGIGRQKSAEIQGSKHATRKSLGVKLTSERLGYQNEMAELPDMEIVDLYNTDGSSAGTRVIIHINISE